MKPVRLWVEPPQPDETWLSFLSRSAQFYGLTRTELTTRLVGSNGRVNTDWDTSLPEADRVRALQAIGVAEHAGPLLRGTLFVPKLPVSSRVSYCPRCAWEDLARRVTPYFRWQWALSTTTLCHVHGSPLLIWTPSAKSYAIRWPSSWLRGASPSSDFSAKDWLLRDMDNVGAIEGGPGYQEAKRLLINVQAPCIRSAEASLSGGIRRCHWPQHAFECIATVLTAMPLNAESVPLAHQLRPRDAPLWWMGDCPYLRRRRLVRNSFRAVMSCRQVSWRRTVWWLVARAMWGGVHRVELTNGSVMDRGNWSRTWDNVIAPLLPDQVREVAREARNVLQSQFPYFICF